MADTGKVTSLGQLIEAIVSTRTTTPQTRAALIGISGIDGSGKGFITTQLDQRLRDLGWSVAVVRADDWLNLPDVCVNRDNPAEHFYDNALRLEEMFDRLILPLRNERRVDIVADCGDAKAVAYRKHHYVFRNIDILLLEGIFLFKSAYRDQFDLKVWIDSSFDIALRRAIARGQEGLPPAETKHAFETIYFPAQQVHFEHDQPREFADVVFNNDSAL